MNLDTFFENFELFADAPRAVDKMRELVLHLAFSGKLLPVGEPWPLVTLKSLASKIGSGATPSGGRVSYVTQGIPLIRSMNVHFRGFEPLGLVFLTSEQADKLSNVIVQADDVLLNITGASIGRVTTAPVEMVGARVNQHVTIIRPTPDLDPVFLAKFLASPAIQVMIDDVQVGATRQALTKGMIERFEIPLPPLAEQKRIVAKVDALMALCDRLEAQQRERDARHADLARASVSRFNEDPTPENLKLLFHPACPIDPADLRKSILTLAVRGKLVPQDPADEGAEELLARVESAKQIAIKSGEMRKPRALADSSLSGHNHPLPESWTWCRIGEIGNASESAIVDGPFGQSINIKTDYIETGVPVIRMVNVKPFRFNPNDLRYIREEKFALLRRHNVLPNDVLLGKVGSIGLCAIYPESMPEGMLSTTGLCRFRVGEVVTAQYLCIYLNAIAEYLRGIASEAVQPFLNMKTICSIQFPLPPLAEQRRIVARVEELMGLVDQLEAQIATSRRTAVALLEAGVSALTN